MFRLFPSKGCTKKLWPLFLPRAHLEKQQQKNGENLQDFILDSGVSEPLHFQYIHIFVNKHCCPFLCFIELYCFFVLIAVSFFLVIAFPVVVSSRSVHEHRMQENSKCRVYQIHTHIHSHTYLLARPHRAFQCQCYSNNIKHRNLKTRKIIN